MSLREAAPPQSSRILVRFGSVLQDNQACSDKSVSLRQNGRLKRSSSECRDDVFRIRYVGTQSALDCRIDVGVQTAHFSG